MNKEWSEHNRMNNDNSTPMAAKEYDKKINQTIPYYSDFYSQTFDIVEQCGFKKIDWLDLGCGTGSLEELAFQKFSEVQFVLVDPSEKMLEQAKMKLRNNSLFKALKKGGIYINFENIIPEDEDIKTFELLRWGRYQQRHGKTEEEAKAHNARCGKNYFPLTAIQHIQLLKDAGFSKVHIFWCSYMQMGIYGVK